MGSGVARMTQRNDRVSSIWDKTKKRSDRVSAIWEPVKKRFDKVNGIWVPSYQGEIPATVRKMYGHWPDQFYGYGDSSHFYTSADTNGINFSYEYTNPGPGENVRDYSSVIISGMPTQSSSVIDLVKCAANIPVTFSRTHTGDITLFLMTDDGTGQTFTITSSGSKTIDLTLSGTNPTTIPAERTQVGDITYDFRLMLVAFFDPYETLSISFTLPWSAFTWLPTGQPLIYQP